MSDFKLLYHTYPAEERREERVQEDKENYPCQELEQGYMVQILELKRQIEELKLRVEGLEKEKEELLKDKEDLNLRLMKREEEDQLLKSISDNLMQALKEALLHLRQETIKLAVDLTKRLLLIQDIPKEHVTLQALSKVFDAGIELKGQINLYLNPQDFQRLVPYLERLKENMSESLQINPMIKRDLKEGEFLVETPKIWIERRYEDILQDLLDDYRNEGNIQSLP